MLCPPNFGIERTWPSSGYFNAGMTYSGFVDGRGLLRVGHAAHPGWLGVRPLLNVTESRACSRVSMKGAGSCS